MKKFCWLLLIAAAILCVQTPSLAQSNLTTDGVYHPAQCGQSSPPSWCSGSDIGAWVNSAIAALSGGCGEIAIAAGNYNFRTTIMKPRCVRLHGQSSYGTVLNWTPRSGVAVVAADTAGATNYPEGELSDLTLNGPGKGQNEAQAIYIGGDSTNNLIASDAYGDTQSFNRLRVTHFGPQTIQIGNNTWNLTFFESNITNNGGNTIYLPKTSTGSGESINFHDSIVGNNNGNALALFHGDFYFYGFRCDYNVSCGFVNVAHFFGAHFEQASGQILSVAGIYQPFVEIYGGELDLTRSSTSDTDSDMIAIDSKLNPTFIMKGTLLYAKHPVTQAIRWNGFGPNPVLDIESIPARSGNIPGGGSGIASLTNLPNNTCNFPGCFINSGESGILSTGARSQFKSIGQTESNSYAGKCSMNNSTTCMFTLGTALTNYLSFASIDQSSTPPSSSISAKCSLSGNTVKITAGNSNSLTWDCLFIGNPD